MKRFIWAVLVLMLARMASADVVSVTKESIAPSADSSKSLVQEFVVAQVEGVQVPLDEYVYLVREAIQERYYHGQIPEAELRSYRRELLDDLIDGYLLAKEASRRGLEPDLAKVAETVNDFDGRASAQQGWEEVRSIWLPRIEAIAVRDGLKGQLEEQVRASVDPSEAEVLAYYQSNLDKFVTPEQNDVSTILLAVDPSSSSDVWRQADEKARLLLAELEGGAAFEELAEIYSADPSAAAGGGMGLLHRGLLGGEIEAALAAMTPGQVSEPMRVLDGVVLLRLNARVESLQRTFEQVRARAHGLLSRELGELEWKGLQFRLRAQADIVLNETLLQELGL